MLSKDRQAAPGSRVRTCRLQWRLQGYGAPWSTTEEALSAVVRTINRVDGIFRLELLLATTIGNNDEIVYTDPDTDRLKRR